MASRVSCRLTDSSTAATSLQDTCTGFLLGGVGEMNAKRQPNFLVVDKGSLYTDTACMYSTVCAECDYESTARGLGEKEREN